MRNYDYLMQCAEHSVFVTDLFLDAMGLQSSEVIRAFIVSQVLLFLGLFAGKRGRFEGSNNQMSEEQCCRY